jgi:hypothetical protein
VAENLRVFIDGGIANLLRVTPAFAGLVSQPKVLTRFHAMVGGNAAFDPAAEDAGERAEGAGERAEGAAEPAQENGDRVASAGEPRGLPDMLTAYLQGEQRLGRIDAAADIDAAASLIVGAMHGQILPRVLFAPPGTPVTVPSGLSARLAEVVLEGIAPGTRRPRC